MRKTMKRMSMLLCMFVLICAGAMTASAIDERTINEKLTMKANSWVSVKYHDWEMENRVTVHTYYYYKITVPKDGYITVSEKCNENETYLALYDSELKKLAAWLENGKNFTFKRAISKGTYYLVFDACAKKAKYTFTPIASQANYAKFNAVNLAARKKVEVVQTPDAHYSRWYKIKITKKKRIAVKRVTDWDTKSTSNAVRLYNSKGKRISLNKDSDGYCRSAKVPAGTYYIRLNNDFYDSDNLGQYSTLTWK